VVRSLARTLAPPPPPPQLARNSHAGPRSPPLSSAAAVGAPVLHIGDTPMDVSAAVAAGGHALGVCTGVYDRSALAAAGPAERVTVLDGLADAGEVMRLVDRLLAAGGRA
jgi:phosphoglycolate phosphatase-like HAD superfamily hydrolase